MWHGPNTPRHWSSSRDTGNAQISPRIAQRHVFDAGIGPPADRMQLGPNGTGEMRFLAIAVPPAVGLGASRPKATGLSPLWKVELAATLTMTTRL